MSRYLAFCFALIVGFFVTQYSEAQTPPFQLNRGDRIAIIGNTTADRMQHSSWLETYLVSQLPEHDLTFRNLGYPGDELKVRSREENFGSPDEWLTKVRANVVFCFFGYNEALRGEAGLDSFRRDLAEVIDGMRSQKYDGESHPQLVFFSPIAHEDLKSPHLPDGSANNPKLALYTQAMREVCQQKQVRFIDLFNASQRLYESSKTPLTMNGIHLTDDGEKELSRAILPELMPNAKLPSDIGKLEELRQAILDKNYYWFSRYRVVDGYNVFGGRSKLAWFGQSNADVMMREMEIFDVKTANRDKGVWKVARGGNYEVADDNLPEELTVRTNIPGKLSDGRHEYLGGKEAIGKMKIAEGMQANLFASEEMFPELINPVQMAVDPDGRLFVSVWPSYPHWNPVEPRRDKIICLPDDNGDGVADRCVTFADELNSVTGMEFWNGGMLVAALPEIWFLKDTDGDDKADLKIRMLQGVCSADSHHSANAMLLGPDGWVYWSRGIFNVSVMETPTRTVRSEQSGVHRFNPRTFEMEFHFPIGPNPHGDVFDQWGYQFANDGTSGTGSYVNIGKGLGNKQWFKMRVRPVAANGILSSSHFPEANQGNFLLCNCIGFLGVLQHRVEYNGADITATEIEPILVSSDPNFRPSDVEVGGDGALYVSDWCNAIIGHMQHNMRDPNRDRDHGRVYRVTATGRPLVAPVKLRGKPISEVLKAFFAKENSSRYRARIELSGRDTKDVIAALTQWNTSLDPARPDDAQALLEGLWVLEEHRVPNMAWIEKTFAAREPRVRAAAIRTLGHWAGKVKDWEDLLSTASRDESALVRAEAVKAAVEFGGETANEAVMQAAVLPIDPEMNTVLAYAKDRLRTNEKLQQLISQKQTLSHAATRYALAFAPPEDLMKLPQTEEVLEAVLRRSKVPSDILRRALEGLSSMRKTSVVPLILAWAQERDAQGDVDALPNLRDLLVQQSPSELRKGRGLLQQLATQSKQPATRQLGFAAWIVAEGNGDAPFATASTNKELLRDLLLAFRDLKQDGLQRSLFPSVRGWMFELPPSLASEPGAAVLSQPGIHVDYFYPAPDNVALETLAPLTPKASGIVPKMVMNVPQKTEADDFALKFNGNLTIAQSGKYTFFIASDDGSRVYIDDRLVIDNDGLHGMSEKQAAIELTAGLHRIAVTYFDNGGGDGLQVAWSGPGFKKQEIATEMLSVGGEETIHDLAIRAVASIPGFEKEKFADWVSLIKADRHRSTAVQALKALPQSAWDPREVPGLVDNLVGFVSSIPARLRTSGSAVETIELIQALAAKLPPDQAASIRERLQNLDVRVIAIGTVVERMNYDKEKIAVAAGKPVEFRFSNLDNMPHNLVFVKPGALEEVGLEAERTAQDADARDRQFVPVSDKILLASKLLGPGETHSLVLDVPSEPGMYPYVCTYPGHWRRMFGVLVVVKDIESYQANPDAYLAANPLTVRDELLNSIGRNTEWKVSDLVADIKQAEKDRSYEVGRSLFRAANCVGCHQLGGEGKAFGPDLAKLEPKKQTAEAILKAIIEPSADIEDKYRSRIFQMSSGAIVTGMVTKEDDQSIHVMVDPLAKGEPTILEKSEIEGEKTSAISTMPQGLLNRLTREEILDLVGYVLAGGDKKHAAFGGHDHDHHH
ncbi:MAG: c-type cytochrome [Planctomycetes bacterium]|nr:c-type cytochrome [Planctomycetota bacterium]